MNKSDESVIPIADTIIKDLSDRWLDKPVQRPPDEVIHQQRTANTVAKRKGEWFDNVKANTGMIVKDLSALWVDKPGGEIISIAAGPSLSEEIEEIKKMRKSREIIVVDAAFKYCVDQDIMPDYVICTDSSDKILSMWKDMENIRPKLILNVMANPKVAQFWGENIYWFVMANMIMDKDHGKIIQDMHSIESKIGTKLIPGGNVSSVALGFCLSIRNANKVHLFGHDFCWKEDFYCGGNMKELADERMRMESESKTIYKEKNTKGEDIYTNLSLKQYAIWHEQAIVNMKHRVKNHTKSTILKA